MKGMYSNKLCWCIYMREKKIKRLKVLYAVFFFVLFLELLGSLGAIFFGDTSMIRDFYYQGQTLQKKYVHIRISLYSFLFGLGVAILSHFLIYWT